MELTISPKERQAISEPPRLLTPSEIVSLRREMQEASAWMRAELNRREKVQKTAYTGQMWMQDMLESCKRMNSDEAYRKEIAKRQS